MLSSYKFGDKNNDGLEFVAIIEEQMQLECSHCHKSFDVQPNRFETAVCDSEKCASRREGEV